MGFHVTDALTREFLRWLSIAPRTYAEVMEAWRTSCPRHSTWEDALANGLIQIENAPGRWSPHAPVTLTPQGHAVLTGDPPGASDTLAPMS